MAKKKTKEHVTKEKVTKEQKEQKEQKETKEEQTEETENETIEEVDDVLSDYVKEQIKELKNDLLKEQADMQNTKKRLEKERITERKYAAMNVCKNLLTPLDHFNLALKHETTSEENEKIFQGFKMIKDQLNKALEDEGVSVIDALNEEYDPNFHQAIMTEKVEDKEANVVLEVLQEGYMFKDRVIRPAIVKISE